MLGACPWSTVEIGGFPLLADAPGEHRVVEHFLSLSEESQVLSYLRLLDSHLTVAEKRAARKKMKKDE